MSEYLLISDKWIDVRCDDPGESAVTRVSRQLRNEILQIFYHSDYFLMHINADDNTAVHFMATQRLRHRSKALQQKVQRLGVELPQGQADAALALSFEPNWRNLVAWVALYHKGKLMAPPMDDDATDEGLAAYAAFELVGGMRGEDWETVQKVLPGVRSLLAAREPRWLW